jgi:hypothetical protein
LRIYANTDPIVEPVNCTDTRCPAVPSNDRLALSPAVEIVAVTGEPSIVIE